MSRAYKSPGAFRQAIDARLVAQSIHATHSLDRLRQELVFNRFLVRLSSVFGDAMIVKGGIAMELRLPVARATRDVDIMVSVEGDEIASRVSKACRLDVGDYMAFTAKPLSNGQPGVVRTLPGKIYRFRVECKVAGTRFAWPFGVDVATGDIVIGVADEIVAPDLLDFMGVPPAIVRAYPVTTHIAEKLHAYTQPRDGRNSRIRDLPDIGLLAGYYPVRSAELTMAITATFHHRATHEPPSSLPHPPEFWNHSYPTMAAQDSLPWPDLQTLMQAVGAFLNPILDGTVASNWDPATWSWESL